MLLMLKLCIDYTKFSVFIFWFLWLYVAFCPQKLCGCKYQHQPVRDQRAVAVFSCLVCGCSLCHYKCCPHPQEPAEASLTDGKWHTSVSTHVWLSGICSCHSWFVSLCLLLFLFQTPYEYRLMWALTDLASFILVLIIFVFHWWV